MEQEIPHFNGWHACKECKKLYHQSQLESNLYCCPHCHHHEKIPARMRLDLLCDEDSIQELFSDLESNNPLNFADTQDYGQRLKLAQQKTENLEAFIAVRASIHQTPLAIGIMDFDFMAGSLNATVGHKIVLLCQYAIDHRLPLLIITASGGARMQESVLSLMQMAKTSAMIAKLREAQIPYITLLTDPTCGGTTASFASLGDVMIAEPNALICFAGPRVIEQTIKQKLPKGAQKAEFLFEHGLIDDIVPRNKLRDYLSNLLLYTADALTAN